MSRPWEADDLKGSKNFFDCHIEIIWYCLFIYSILKCFSIKSSLSLFLLIGFTHFKAMNHFPISLENFNKLYINESMKCKFKFKLFINNKTV
jgi:hypothetical protein